MPNWSGSTLTTKGLALQAKVDAGETTLTLTKMKIGSGTLSTGASIEDLTDLISGQLDVTISDISAADNITTVTGVITNASVTTGFYITELGLFATDTDATEILYSMITDGSPDYFPAASGDVTVSEEFAYNLVVSNASSVTATIDQTGLITAAILAAHKEATPIDHPDSSVTDAKIGNREIDDTVEAASGAGVLTNLLSKIGNMIKSITGKSSWYTAPDVSLAEVLPLAGGTITGDLVVEGTTTFDSYYSSIVNICCEEYHSVPVLTAENKSTKVYRKLFTLPATTTGIRGDVLLKMSLAGIEASQGRGYVDLLVSSRGSLLSVGKIFGTIANVDIEIYLNSNSTYSVYATGYGYVASTFSSIMSTHNNVTWDFKTSEETTTTPDGTLEYTLSSASNTAILSVAGKLTVPSLEVDGTTTLDGTLAVAGNVGIGTSATPPRDAVTGRHYLTIKGSTGLGALELTSAASDADAVQIGHIAFVDSNCSVTENGIAFVTAYLDGDTSNNRGGALAFSTKADNATTISERMRITADGYVGVITTSPTAALDLPASTTSRASLRVRAGTAPTSPNAGDLYNNGSSLYFYNGSTAYNLCNSSVGTGSIRGLKILVTSNTAITVTADEVPLLTSGNIRTSILGCSYAISTASSGSGGLDTDSIAASTWYYVYIISNGSVSHGILSLSATSPALPSGYTYYRRVGAVLTDSDGYLYRMIQKGRDAQYIVDGTLLTAFPTIASGSNSSTLTAASVSSYVPTTAGKIRLNIYHDASNGTGVKICSNSNSGSVAYSYSGNQYESATITQAEMVLESTNIYYSSNNSSNYVTCVGWTDNL